jgi:DNA-binding transcriptional regulator GbsR (MarR family)
MARICLLYGVNPLAGRLYAQVFVATEPLTLDELCARTGAAKSTVSVAIRTLARARVVRLVPPRGDRRDRYEGVTDPWALLADWNRQYFQPELAMFRDTGEVLERALAGADAPRGPAAAELRARLERMREFSRVFDDLMTALPGTRAPVARARTIEVER